MLKSLFVFFLTISNLYGQYQLKLAIPRLADTLIAAELTNAQDGTHRLFINYVPGLIFVINNSDSVITQKVFIDLRPKISNGTYGLGLSGIAFHPNFEINRYFYVHYVMDSVGSPSGHWIRVSKFIASSTNPDSASISTEQILLTIPMPTNDHNGGKLAFGPDRYFYISLGDGHTGGDLAQDKTKLSGKILRINVDSASGGRNYSIPSTNPFFGNTQGYREEIYAYGFRNPWKFSFDFETNRLWVGDVGELLFEEIDLVENGKNYGWNKMEGFHCYPDTNSCDTANRNFTLPIWEYPHPLGNSIKGSSITGGYVYRGKLLPDLYGKYIYGDFVEGKIWALTYDGINPTINQLLVDSNLMITTFGIDENNELFIVNFSGDIYRLSTMNIILNLKVAIEGFYDVTNNRLNLSDSSWVYLHSTTTPYTIIDSSRTVIDSLTLNGLCFFNEAPSGQYYIRIKHRNSIETWSRSGGEAFISGNIKSYDFTTSSNKAFGNNMKQVDASPVRFAIYSGDVDQNGVVEGTDAVATDNDVFNFVTGYVNTDVTGDYVVDASDAAITGNNAFNFVVKITP